jgi:tetratricopeptide (TPR) repeat protein/transcriptional regulator with XRE-family HTH domain
MEPATALAFGLLLKRTRRAAKLTQAELAERAGFSTDYISKLERGARHPQRATVTLLADALALSPSERAALESAARPLHTERVARMPHLPTGAFLGAIPLAPLVGREAELARVGAALEAVVSGHGRLLVLTGEPGVGKTRLAQEISMLARARSFRILTGRCYEPQQSVAYYPFLEALTTVAEGIDSEESPELSERWPEVARLLPNHPENVHAPAQINDRAAQQRLFWQVTDLLRTLADQAPIVVLLDDVHWADTASVDLAQHLARHTRDRRIFIVATYRDGEANRMLAAALHDLTRDELVERITVGLLSSDETTALINVTLGNGVEEGALSGVASVSLHLAQLIYQRSEGNAFFTRQLARVLWEQGDLRFEDDEWRLRGSSDFSTPESIRAVINQRLARLTPPTQDTLREASVLGQVFAFVDLERMRNRGEQEVEEALEEATRGGLIREGEADRYHFNHVLTRDALYADLSARRKQRLHGAAACAIEQSPDYERRTAELVYHLLAADKPARLLPYALLAGDQAEATYAHAEAETNFRLALKIADKLGDQPRLAEAREKLGNAIYLQGRHHEASELLVGALGGYNVLGEQEAELRALAALLESEGMLGRQMVEVAVARAQETLARLEPTDASTLAPARAAGLAAVYRGLSVVYMGSGRYDEQLTAAKRAVELASAAGDEAQLAWAMHRLYASARVPEDPNVRQEILEMAARTGQTMIVVFSHNMLAARYAEAGEMGLALPHMEEALAMAERRQDPIHLAWQLRNRTYLLFFYGDWQGARATSARASAIMHEADQHDSTWHAAGVSIWPGMFALAEGREEEGRHLLEQAMRRIEEVGSFSMLDSPVCLLAEADLLSGHAERAQRRLTSFLQSSHLADTQAEALDALARLAWAEGALGQMAQAEKTVAMVLLNAEPLVRVEALRVQGLIATMRGKWKVARAALDEALERTRAMPYPYAEVKTLWIYGRMMAVRGQPAVAREHFTAALAICDRLGEGLYRKHIERDLSGLTPH